MCRRRMEAGFEASHEVPKSDEPEYGRHSDAYAAVMAK
jgi:hypothetical protein